MTEWIQLYNIKDALTGANRIKQRIQDLDMPSETRRILRNQTGLLLNTLKGLERQYAPVSPDFEEPEPEWEQTDAIL